ncbi:UB Xdomain protein Ubx4 [Schizosaccharomyces octosporus yFS286]|uniref:UB Xdomain protein Ubx4 n=1 Tax=Schizosaccharomyces octosporus (strain yFS286) TaxID=483514 RepID=S9PPL2_SCHOY|nr:UB Xdomain protein Ubx4 [Schizosaccharomyces octosporus yFS286]EPX71156.1 UB Xdomain protein Ubx4 [Schizosaccharomyces octosporus yFS286]
MTTVFACKGFQKCPVKLTPSAPLQEVVLASYEKLGFSDWSRLELFHNDKKLDLSTLMRHSGLSQGSKLTVKESQQLSNALRGSSSASGGQLKVALQMPGFPRVVDQISSQDTLLHLLEKHSFLSNVDHVLINGRVYRESDFQQPLLLFGLHEGSVLIRLIPKPSKPTMESTKPERAITSPTSQLNRNSPELPEKTTSMQDFQRAKDFVDARHSSRQNPPETNTSKVEPTTMVPSPKVEPPGMEKEEVISETPKEPSSRVDEVEPSSLQDSQESSRASGISKSKGINNKNILGSMMSKIKKEKKIEREQDEYDLEPSKSQLELYQNILRKRASQPSRTISSDVPKNYPSTATVKFDFGDGKPLYHEFSKEDKIPDLHNFVTSHLPNGFPSSFSLTFSNYEPLPTSGHVVEYIGRAVVRVHPSL